MTKEETLGWHHQFNGHGFEQTPGIVKDRSLVSCSPWDHKELDMTEQLKNNERTRKLVKLVQSLRRHLHNLLQAC